MGENSSIEWTDHTFNPFIGCTKVSPGCANCYAERRSRRFPEQGQWGPGAPRKRTSEANWRKPLTWARAARAAVYPCHLCGKQATCFGVYEDPQGQAPRPACDDCCGHGCEDGWCEPVAKLRPRVFCASLADWLDPEIPAEWLADLLALIAQTPELDWLLLTKRPQLWRDRIEAALRWVQGGGYAGRDPAGFALCLARWLGGKSHPKNAWVGTSVEDQERADERIPALLQIPARVRFLSCEPLLGAVDVVPWLPESSGRDHVRRAAALRRGLYPAPGTARIGWVIAGGESGTGARPMHPGWARSLRDQCVEAGVAFFMKQWGAWAPVEAGSAGASGLLRDGLLLNPGDECNLAELMSAVSVQRVGKKAAGRELDGRTWDEVPS